MPGCGAEQRQPAPHQPPHWPRPQHLLLQWRVVRPSPLSAATASCPLRGPIFAAPRRPFQLYATVWSRLRARKSSAGTDLNCFQRGFARSDDGGSTVSDNHMRAPCQSFTRAATHVRARAGQRRWRAGGEFVACARAPSVCVCCCVQWADVWYLEERQPHIIINNCEHAMVSDLATGACPHAIPAPPRTRRAV